MENIIGIEVMGRYDGISHREDEQGNKYSRIAKIPIECDELCRYGKIYKVEHIDDYTYKVLSEREDLTPNL